MIFSHAIAKLKFPFLDSVAIQDGVIYWVPASVPVSVKIVHLGINALEIKVIYHSVLLHAQVLVIALSLIYIFVPVARSIRETNSIISGLPFTVNTNKSPGSNEVAETCNFKPIKNSANKANIPIFKIVFIFMTL